MFTHALNISAFSESSVFVTESWWTVGLASCSTFSRVFITRTNTPQFPLCTILFVHSWSEVFRVNTLNLQLICKLQYSTLNMPFSPQDYLFEALEKRMGKCSQSGQSTHGCCSCAEYKGLQNEIILCRGVNLNCRKGEVFLILGQKLTRNVLSNSGVNSCG